MQVAVLRLEGCIKELRVLNVAAISQGDDPAVTALSARITSTLASIYGEHTAQFERLRNAADLDDTFYTGALVLGGEYRGTPPEEICQGVDRGRNGAIALLAGEVHSLKEELQYVPEGAATEPPSAATKPQGQEPAVKNDEIFIVHGRDVAAKNEVEGFIRRAGLMPIILHDQPNSGRTIIEKFERYAAAAGFAVVILTPDDVGGPNRDELQPRARQNVIGELFWFAGKLGRARVCALKKRDLEIPTDFAGVVYTEMDDRGAWKTELLKELRAAGYKVDWEKALA